MPRYDFRCDLGHVTEAVFPMADVPASIHCTGCPDGGDARRVFTAPAAIHFKGPGFYATDVKGRVERRRRPNAGDDLHREHDPVAADIAAHA